MIRKEFDTAEEANQCARFARELGFAAYSGLHKTCSTWIAVVYPKTTSTVDIIYDGDIRNIQEITCPPGVRVIVKNYHIDGATDPNDITHKDGEEYVETRYGENDI